MGMGILSVIVNAFSDISCLVKDSGHWGGGGQGDSRVVAAADAAVAEI